MRRLDSAIPVGHQALSDITNLCVRECVSKYRVFDRGFGFNNTSARRAYPALKESKQIVKVGFWQARKES